MKLPIESSFYTDNGFHCELIPLIEASVRKGNHWLMHEVCFVLFKPDAIASGQVPDMVRHLGELGLFPLYFDVLLAPSLRNFEELYKFNLTQYNQQNMLGAWWLNSKVYVAGPSAIALIAIKGVSDDYFALSSLNATPPSHPT